MTVDQEAIQEKAKALDNSRPLDAGKVSNHPEAKVLVQHVFGEIIEKATVSKKKKDQKNLRGHIRAIVMDLYDAYVSDPELYLGYSRNRNDYGPDSRNKAIFFSYRNVIKVVDFLGSQQYIENHPGKRDPENPSLSRISRMRATKKLLDLLTVEHKVPPDSVEKAPDTECIILRDVVDLEVDGKSESQKVDIPYTDTPETKRMRKDLIAYNNLLRRTYVDVAHYPKKGVPSKSGKRMIKFNRNHKFVRRVFNNGTWEDGGRFWGGFWQRLPRQWRTKIWIGGSPTAEIDYSGLHIVILYALEGVDYWKEDGVDPYLIEGFEQSERMRDFLKQVLLRAINSDSAASVVRSINWEIITDDDCEFKWIKDEGINIREVVECFADRHPTIKDKFFKGCGVKLQHIDSIIAEHVINEMTKQNIPILCVHDSFVVSSFHSETVRQMMKDAYKKIINQLEDPNVKMKDKGITKPEQTYWMGSGMRGPFSDRDTALEKLGITNNDRELHKRYKEHNGKQWEDEYYFDNGKERRGIFKEG